MIHVPNYPRFEAAVQRTLYNNQCKFNLSITLLFKSENRNFFNNNECKTEKILHLQEHGTSLHEELEPRNNLLHFIKIYVIVTHDLACGICRFNKSVNLPKLSRFCHYLEERHPGIH